MKRLSVLVLVLVGLFTAQAQHTIYPFFDDKGAVRIETTELNDAADTLVTVFHRADDIVWSRIVYRVIDMRYKQNFQLYFPTNPDDNQYQSLFRLITGAIIDGMPIYEADRYTIKPKFDEEHLLEKSRIPDQFIVGTIADLDRDDEDSYLVLYDSINDELRTNFSRYDNFVRNQLKYLIQEIIFFDKHTSRLCTKIIAIAPLQPDMALGTQNPYSFLMYSRKFWVAFDDLRPYLARHYMIPQKNDNRRVTFDEFFGKKLYTSYLVGDSNMYDRMIINEQYDLDEAQVRREQQALFEELLNFEQDLWEY